jgi:hypothetical protein
MDREPRDADLRGEDEHIPNWRPPETIPAPDPRPGWSHRWMRMSSLGEVDTLNVGAYRREGWEFCIPSDYPELPDLVSEDGDRVEIGGLVLVKIPTKTVRQRDQYYRDMSDRQLEAMNNQLMAENDSRMPMFVDRQTKTTRNPRG